MSESLNPDALTMVKAVGLNQIQDTFKRVEILFTIVAGGQGDAVVKSLRECGVTYNLTSVGYGAAAHRFTDFLGFNDLDKDIVISVVTKDRVRDILNMLLYKFDIDKPDKGIAFTVPISGVSGPLALKYISGFVHT
ncbi:MAG: hypothetical protein LBE16_08270 [Clostridiales Family XIII bacterium]|jgi:hypothetical protein|nr:hypothetical protein [Clostridiales Family XIII bacterium]